MEFNPNKPIYLQICDAVCEKVLSGELREQDRMLSVREHAAEIGVNPNTLARSYEKLCSDGIIFNRRGIGFFISEGARVRVLESLRKEFLCGEWPVIRRRIELLGLSSEELLK